MIIIYYLKFNLHFSDLTTDDEKGSGGIWLFGNSSLAFNLNNITVNQQTNDSLFIAVRAMGSEAAGYFAHFNLIVNGRYCGGAFTTATDSVYVFGLESPRKVCIL